MRHLEAGIGRAGCAAAAQLCCAALLRGHASMEQQLCGGRDSECVIAVQLQLRCQQAACAEGHAGSSSLQRVSLCLSCGA